MPAADALRRQVFVERREFEAATGLTRVAVALPGHYARLREMIVEFAKHETLEDLGEAAQLWERMVYWPGARIIRASGWRQHFPDPRTADIFLLLSHSLDRLTRQEGRHADWEEALSSLLAEGAAAPAEDSPRRGVSGALKNVLGRS